MEIWASEVTYAAELKRWSIVYPAEQYVRHVNQTGGDYYAVIRLSVEPYDGPENVAFVNAVSYEDYVKEMGSHADNVEVFHSYVESVRMGVEIFLRERVHAGCPLAHFLITLHYICTHPIDSSNRAFERAAIIGMNECFAKGGLIRID